MSTLIIILLLPIVAAIMSWLVPKQRVPFINIFFSVIGAVVTVGLAFSGENLAVAKFDWLSVAGKSITLGLRSDAAALTMLSIVSLVSACVQVFSSGYMKDDEQQKKYFSMLSLFTFSMMGIVLADNLLGIFGFWELVGFCSYMLIGHWQDDIANGRAATKAFIMNRIGDAGFIVSIAIVWAYSDSLLIGELGAVSIPSFWKNAAGIGLFLGVMGKSAQFPFSIWLPDAMRGPTPVSALIHAATMVAAGVYLLVTLYPMLTPFTLQVIFVVGATTAWVGALSALSQFDIKRVLAYSTISQLGLMMVAIGLEAPASATLHLYTHAFFKACLFLSAGSIIHALHHINANDPQDIRQMGLKYSMPITFVAFAISASALAGLPLTNGFQSKEGILAAAWNAFQNSPSAFSSVAIATITGVSLLTVLYSARLVWFVFFKDPQTPIIVKENNAAFILPLAILATGSLWFCVNMNPFSIKSPLITGVPVASIGLTIFSLLFAVSALLIFRIGLKFIVRQESSLFSNGFYADRFITRAATVSIHASTKVSIYFDQLIDRFIHASTYVQVTLAHITGWVDRNLVDGTVRSVAIIAAVFGTFSRSFHGGRIQLYLFWALLSLIIFIIWSLN